MCRLLPCPRGLPQTRDGSASASHLSRPAQTSFALRPAGSLNRPRRPLSRGSDPTSYPVRSLVSYQINRQLSGWNLPPLMIHAFGAHPSFQRSSRAGHSESSIENQAVSRLRSLTIMCWRNTPSNVGPRRLKAADVLRLAKKRPSGSGRVEAFQGSRSKRLQFERAARSRRVDSAITVAFSSVIPTTGLLWRLGANRVEV